MKTFKFFWTTHKWTGIVLAAVFSVTAVTGFLLLVKKKYEWIQPPTISGEAGGVEDFITTQELFEIVLAQGHPEFQSMDDIDRVDFRPGKRVFKVRSNSFHEIQIDAVTGAVLHTNNVAMQVSVEDPVETTADDIARVLDHERQKVANHAYGFISRGNRDGGFAHIRQWLEKETVVEESYPWFFHEMRKWETSDPALFFAQEYLGQLLKWQLDNEALKLIGRCLHENARWRPLQEDRDEVNGLAARHGREDLIKLLKN